MASTRKIALLGNPNVGKSSLFNCLTNLRQKTGNYPGVTVDKKIGYCTLSNNERLELQDLPGLYSLFAKSIDEGVVINTLLHTDHHVRPTELIVLLDATRLRQSLLLAYQLLKLGLPVLFVVNKMDLAAQSGNHINQEAIKDLFHEQVIFINARTEEGIDALKERLIDPIERIPTNIEAQNFIPNKVTDKVQENLDVERDNVLYYLLQYPYLSFLKNEQRVYLQRVIEEERVNVAQIMRDVTVQLYHKMDELLPGIIVQKEQIASTNKLDQLTTHPIWGNLIFISLLLLIFQAIFAWAAYPMDWIDQGFARMSQFFEQILPNSIITDAFVNGIIPGLNGVLIFIPQIAILFGFIAILEESGYMARVVVLMDKLFQHVGLSGRSIVPLISGVACAIPAVMAARTIANPKERLITILVTPLMSCSARLPVYTVLIALVVPNKSVFGLLNLQGLVLFAMYVIGTIAALLASLILKWILKQQGTSTLVMELTNLQIPKWKNVGIEMLEKVKIFTFQAGRIILVISVILWVLASFGPGSLSSDSPQVNKPAYTVPLEESFAGILGKKMEPVIAPLGFDWKIGMALITSFAAREVFVGTLSTIYKLADEDDTQGLIQKLANEKRPKTGQLMYTPALGFSLLIFYAFAMQCMSTLAIVYRETKSWKWPLVQLIYMTGAAYFFAWITYVMLS